MLVRTYASNEETLFLALEDVYFQFRDDFLLNEFDFIIFAVSPKFLVDDINPTIKKIFKTENFLAFNATHAFSNNTITETLSALFIKFERNGKINIKHSLSNLNQKNLNVVIYPYIPNKCISNEIEKFNMPTIGGICSGDEAYVFVDGKIIKDKPVVLEFENVDYEFGISLGYKPIGPTYKVQVAKDNRIYVIDYEDASLLAKNILKNTDGKITNLWYSPLLIVSDKSGIVKVVRTFKDIKENHYVEFFGKIDKNSHVKLSFGEKEMLLKEDEKTAINLRKKIAPELIFNFSCVAREFILEDKAKVENEIYTKYLNAPLFGFFTYGEIGPDFEYKNSKLYNQSSLVVALKEK